MALFKNFPKNHEIIRNFTIPNSIHGIDQFLPGHVFWLCFAESYTPSLLLPPTSPQSKWLCLAVMTLQKILAINGQMAKFIQCMPNRNIHLLQWYSQVSLSTQFFQNFIHTPHELNETWSFSLESLNIPFVTVRRSFSRVHVFDSENEHLKMTNIFLQ